MLAVALSAAMVVPSGATGGSDDPLWLAGHLEHAVPGAAAARHLAAWQRAADSNGGTRATGTPGFTASAGYLVRQLARAGYRVTRQPVPYQDFKIDVEHVAELTPGAAPVRAYLLRFSPVTPVGGIDAPVVVVPAGDPTPACEPDDLAGRPVQGSVVVAPRG